LMTLCVSLFVLNTLVTLREFLLQVHLHVGLVRPSWDTTYGCTFKEPSLPTKQFSQLPNVGWPVIHANQPSATITGARIGGVYHREYMHGYKVAIDYKHRGPSLHRGPPQMEPGPKLHQTPGVRAAQTARMAVTARSARRLGGRPGGGSTPRQLSRTPRDGPATWRGRHRTVQAW